MLAGYAARTCALLALCLLGSAAQDFGPTRFICTSVPVDADLCTASVAAGGAEELRSSVLQLRETVLQQKETILSQKETIRELTTKLGRCESQSTLDAGAGEARAGSGRKQPGSGKNTMGDLSRTPAAETLSQLGQTLQSLKTRLENLEVRARRGFPSGSRAPLPLPTPLATRPDTPIPARPGPPRGCGAPRQAAPAVAPGEPRREPPGRVQALAVTLWSPPPRPCTPQQYSRLNSSSQTNSLKDLLQSKIDDLERQVLSRVNTLEEGKGGPKNDTEERVKIESALTSLHQRISELEKGNNVGGGSLLQAWLLLPVGPCLGSWPPTVKALSSATPPLPPTHLPPRSGLPVTLTGLAQAPGLWLALWRESREREGLPGGLRTQHAHSQDFSKSGLFNLQ